VSPFKTTRATTWTRERVEQLGRQEVLQLQANAVRLEESELAALCAEVLKHLPARGPASGGAGSQRKARLRLIARTKAFEARGVWLQDMRASWSGVRKADGLVVFALWASAIESRDGGCYCLLWAPNADGARAWSDSAAGRERLEHCKTALGRGEAEALLVHGEALEGRLPEERARTVLGIDPATVVAIRVEQRGDEYWAVWGGRSPSLAEAPAEGGQEQSKASAA
jgi:hypothetical protein